MRYSINQVNWKDLFPECPEVTVDVCNDHRFLYLTYYVRGRQLRAISTDDQGPVWEDSCVEFFCQVPGERYYMNFECNCIGAMVASRRKGRSEHVQPLSPAQMAQIGRQCTFPREVIEERDGWFSWSVKLSIPLKLIFHEKEITFPQVLRVNFYKCADKTKMPHFVSWQPIRTAKPDFHCPEFFGEITLNG